MSLESSIVEVESREGVTTRNLLLYHEPASSRLVVMLPGRNYSCDAPVLYYIRLMALEHDFDVLSLQYGFQIVGATPNYEGIVDEATHAVATALTRGYREVCFVGKSLGSPLALALAQSTQVAKVSAILLTPIPAALKPTSGVRALSVVGTADPVFHMPECQESLQRGDMEWVVLEGLDHGLRSEGNWVDSITALKRITAECEHFLTSSHAASNKPLCRADLPMV
ncbi:MAG: hypothetical protein AB1774_07365 [Bacillota bacterium]